MITLAVSISSIQQRKYVVSTGWVQKVLCCISFKPFSSDDNRMQCDIVGGSPQQNLNECLVGDFIYDLCDAYMDINCEYLGEESDLSFPDDVEDATECEQLCKDFEVGIFGILAFTIYSSLHIDHYF